MDLIRLIKLKKLNNELDNLTEPEELLCEVFNKLYKLQGSNIYAHRKTDKKFLKFDEHNSTLYSTSTLFFKFYDEFEYLNSEYNKLIENFFKERLNIQIRSIIIVSLSDEYLLMPTEDPNSNCYGCTAGMCDHQICRGDQYFWNVSNVMR